MRGDSLRDLYAKVLALCGLGLLAGAGALVDYWPVQEELPRIARRPDLVSVSVPPRADINARVFVPASFRADSTKPAARRRAAAVNVMSTSDVLPPSFVPPVHPSAAEILTAAPGVQLAMAPPAPADVATEPVDTAPAFALVAVAEGSLPRSLPGLEVAPLTFFEEPVLAESDGDGFLSGAFKKTGAVASASLARTGDALVKGGVVAGASILDVFRGLAGAMKKVTPFVP